MTAYTGDVKLMGAVESVAYVTIDDVRKEWWTGEIRGATQLCVPGFTPSYVTVVLLDDPLGRMAGAVIETLDDKSLVLKGDGGFC